MVDLWRDFWIRETGTGQQVAQLHERYMMMIVQVHGCALVKRMMVYLRKWIPARTHKLALNFDHLKCIDLFSIDDEILYQSHWQLWYRVNYCSKYAPKKHRTFVLCVKLLLTSWTRKTLSGKRLLWISGSKTKSHDYTKRTQWETSEFVVLTKYYWHLN